MSVLYTCKLVENEKGEPVNYEIIGPDGSVLAIVDKFEYAENLLRHLNMKVKMSIHA